MNLISRPAAGQQGAPVINATCPAGAAVLDAVYVSAAGEVSPCDAGDQSKSRCVGFITSKPTATTCIVATGGKVSGFAGLVAGKAYFIDQAPNLGKLVADDAPAGATIVEVGRALDATSILVALDPEIDVP